MEVVYLLAVIFIGVGYIVRTVMIERTKRLAASKETPPEVIEHLARIEARLDKMEARQDQLQAAQEWQQKLLERSD